MQNPMPKDNRTQRTPGAFLEYQKRWVADTNPVKVVEKSRRIGLTWCEAGEDALLAASSEGMDVFYVGYNKDMAQEFIEDCAAWSRHYSLVAAAVEEFVFKDDSEREIQAFRIRYSSGFKIVALSSRPSNLRGKQGKIVIDEAAFHDDLGELLKAALAMLVWGGRVVVISTHDGAGNKFNQLIQDIRAGRNRYSLHTIDFDKALGEGLYQRVCIRRKLTWSQESQDQWRQDVIDFYGDGAAEELFCIPARGSGIFLHQALIESAMQDDIPVVRWACRDDFTFMPELVRRGTARAWCEDYLAPLLEDLDRGQSHFFGQDFGRSGDLSIFWPLARRFDLTAHTPFVLELRNVPFEQQKEIVFFIADRLPRFAGAALDARGNGEYLAEVTAQKYGAWRVRQVMLSRAWYRENMAPFKAAIEDRAMDLPKDSDILDDLRAFKVIDGVAQLPTTRTKGQDSGQRHGDAGIGGALAYYAFRNIKGGPPEYESCGKRRFSKSGTW